MTVYRGDLRLDMLFLSMDELVVIEFADDVV